MDVLHTTKLIDDLVYCSEDGNKVLLTYAYLGFSKDRNVVDVVWLAGRDGSSSDALRRIQVSQILRDALSHVRVVGSEVAPMRNEISLTTDPVEVSLPIMRDAAEVLRLAYPLAPVNRGESLMPLYVSAIREKSSLLVPFCLLDTIRDEKVLTPVVDGIVPWSLFEGVIPALDCDVRIDAVYSEIGSVHAIRIVTSKPLSAWVQREVADGALGLIDGFKWMNIDPSVSFVVDETLSETLRERRVEQLRQVETSFLGVHGDVSVLGIDDDGYGVLFNRGYCRYYPTSHMVTMVFFDDVNTSDANKVLRNPLVVDMLNVWRRKHHCDLAPIDWYTIMSCNKPVIHPLLMGAVELLRDTDYALPRGGLPVSFDAETSPFQVAGPRPLPSFIDLVDAHGNVPVNDMALYRREYVGVIDSLDCNIAIEVLRTDIDSVHGIVVYTSRALVQPSDRQVCEELRNLALNTVTGVTIPGKVIPVWVVPMQDACEATYCATDTDSPRNDAKIYWSNDTLTEGVFNGCAFEVVITDDSAYGDSVNTWTIEVHCEGSLGSLEDAQAFADALYEVRDAWVDDMDAKWNLNLVMWHDDKTPTHGFDSVTIEQMSPTETPYVAREDDTDEVDTSSDTDANVASDEELREMVRAIQASLDTVTALLDKRESE